jgi:hypothetical protein
MLLNLKSLNLQNHALFQRVANLYYVKDIARIISIEH